MRGKMLTRFSLKIALEEKNFFLNPQLTAAARSKKDNWRKRLEKTKDNELVRLEK